MTSSSNGTSLSLNNEMESKELGSKPMGGMSNVPVKNSVWSWILVFLCYLTCVLYVFGRSCCYVLILCYLSYMFVSHKINISCLRNCGVQLCYEFPLLAREIPYFHKYFPWKLWLHYQSPAEGLLSFILISFGNIFQFIFK